MDAPHSHPLDILARAERAEELAGDLTALTIWLRSFAPEDAMAQLQYLYKTCPNLTRVTATIQHLDRLLTAPEGEGDPCQPIADDTMADNAADPHLLSVLIKWRLAQTGEDAKQHHPRLRQLLTRIADRTTPDPAVEIADHAPPASPTPAHAPLLRLARETPTLVSELAVLVTWLLEFVSAEGMRELEETTAVTRSKRVALSTILSLDALLTKPWRSPREHVRGDLSLIVLLIDDRIAKKKGNRQRLEQLREQILAVQRLEAQAAARRRRMHVAFGFADVWD